MRHTSVMVFVVLFISTVPISGTATPSFADSTSGTWTSFGSPLGINGGIKAVCSYSGELVVGGSFGAIGEEHFDDIGVWDGTTWHGLGSRSYDGIWAAVEFEGDLVIAEALTVDRWNGTSWEQMGVAFDATVRALAVVNGVLYAGGNFTRCGMTFVSLGIARWNGIQWESLGTGQGVNDEIQALTEMNGDLIAGGDFTEAGGNPAAHIACWDGVSWSPIGAGTNACINALEVHSDSLIAGGDFSVAGGDSAHKIALWDGATWSELGGGVGGGVTSILVTPDEEVYIGLDHGNDECVLLLSGDEWIPVGIPPDGRVGSLAIWDGKVVAGGGFGHAGGQTMKCIAIWDGASWTLPVDVGGPGSIDAHVNAIELYEGSIVAGGAFRWAGGSDAKSVARVVDDEWVPMGQGFDDPVWSLADYNGELVAGGKLRGVYSWNDSAWVRLGGMMGTDACVYALETFGSDLIAGGSFLNIGGSPMIAIARWDGLTWSSMGTLDFSVRDLAVYNNDLIAGGDFLVADNDTVNRVARWNGASWEPLGAGFNNGVHALLVYEGNLIAAGDFTMSGTDSTRRIAQWDEAGDQWIDIGPDIDREVNSLAVYNGDLVAGGRFFINYDRILRRHNGNWVDFTSVSSEIMVVRRVTYKGADCLIAGGTFSTAGGKASHAIALWIDSTTTSVESAEIEKPAGFQLSIAPNPFNPIVTIRYELQQTRPVSISVYNIQGRLVRTLLETDLAEPGQYSLIWNGRNMANRDAVSGLYFIRFESGERRETRKITLVR